MLQKGIVYLVFFTYSISLLKPVAPLFSDVLAHIFWYSQHIATVHAEKGKYHMHIALMKASNEQEQRHSLPVSKFAYRIIEHLNKANYFDFKIATTPLLHHAAYILVIPWGHIVKCPHPPEFV